LLRALSSAAAVSLPALALLVILGGVEGPAQMVHAMSFQFSRGSLQSVWSALGIERLQPLGQACVLGLIAAAVVKLRQQPELARDRARMAALTAAILIGLQLAADYWAFLYLSWVAPALCLSLLAQQPTPSEATQRAAASSSTVRTLRPAVTR
jgi:hypothetical protein